MSAEIAKQIILGIIIGNTMYILIYLLFNKTRWKKVIQRIGKSEKPLSLQNLGISKYTPSEEHNNLSKEHSELSIELQVQGATLKDVIVSNVRDIKFYLMEEKIKEDVQYERLKNRHKELQRTVSDIYLYLKDWQALLDENKSLKEQITALSKENNDLKNAMLSIDAGWQYDNSQGRGRSR